MQGTEGFVQSLLLQKSRTSGTFTSNCLTYWKRRWKRLRHSENGRRSRGKRYWATCCWQRTLQYVQILRAQIQCFPWIEEHFVDVIIFHLFMRWNQCNEIKELCSKSVSGEFLLTMNHGNADSTQKQWNYFYNIPIFSKDKIRTWFSISTNIIECSLQNIMW